MLVSHESIVVPRLIVAQYENNIGPIGSVRSMNAEHGQHGGKQQRQKVPGNDDGRCVGWMRIHGNGGLKSGYQLAEISVRKSGMNK